MDRQALTVITTVALAGLVAPIGLLQDAPGSGSAGASTVTFTPGVRVDEPAATDATDPETADHRISCGGFSPIDRRCGKKDKLHSVAVKVDINVEPGFLGRVHERVTSGTGNILYECTWEEPALPDTPPTSCSLDTNGSFRTGQHIQVKGKTVIPGSGLTEDSYGQWEVALTNK